MEIKYNFYLEKSGIMNKELKAILSKEVSELDLVKAHLAFSYHKYNSFVLNWCLCDDTIKELKRLGVDASIGSDYHGDYTNIRW